MVAGISLLDAVAKGPSAGDNGTTAEAQVRVANELVAAALDEHRHIEALDVCGSTGKWRRLYVRETEVQMRRLHEEWLSAARELFGRMREMRRAGKRIDRLDELDDAILSTRGVLAGTLDEIEAGREQARRGEVYSVEELRRELRAERGR